MVESSLTRGWTVAHEFFFEYGGAERVAQRLAEAVPDSDVVYLGGDNEVLARMGLLDRARCLLPPVLVRRHTYHALTPVYHRLLGRAPMIEGNLLISGYAFAPGIKATGRRVVYCHSPLRQIWSGHEEYVERLPKLQSLALSRLADRLRRMDVDAYRGVSRILVPSSAVADRVRDIYGREAEVVAPPFDDTIFTPSASWRDPRQFVTTARLVDAYKNISFLLRVFERIPECSLTVIGAGRDGARLRAAAPANVTFVGERSSLQVAAALQVAGGYVQANAEDFGIAAVESIACGTPVNALARGGALDFVRDRVNGRLFDRLDEAEVASALRQNSDRTWDPLQVAHSVAHLRPAAFVAKVKEVLLEAESEPVERG
jgi:glycosyltransferase involved in cell wall biosynthesis